MTVMIITFVATLSLDLQVAVNIGDRIHEAGSPVLNGRRTCEFLPGLPAERLCEMAGFVAIKVTSYTRSSRRYHVSPIESRWEVSDVQ